MEDINKILDKMENLWYKRDEEFMLSDGHNRVRDVRYLGKIKMDYEIQGQTIEQEKDVFVIEEQIDGKIYEKVYTEDMEILGLLDEERDEFIPTEKMADKREEINKIKENDEKLIDLRKEKDETTDKIAEKKGIDKEEVKRIIKINAKQEIPPDQLVNDYETFEQTLNIQGKYKNIYVVDSYQAGLRNETELSIVGEKEDGTIEDLSDFLEMDTATGDRGQADSINIDADEIAKENNQTISRFNIKGTDNTVSISQGEQGTSEAGEYKVYVGRRATGSNETVEHQVETTNVWPTTRDIRGVQEKNEGKYHSDDIIEEYKIHQDAGEEETKDVRDVDGNKETKTHDHIEEVPENYNNINERTRETLIEELVNEFKGNPETARVYTDNELRGKIENLINNNIIEDNGDVQKFIEKKEELKRETEEEASRIPTRDEHI